MCNISNSYEIVKHLNTILILTVMFAFVGDCVMEAKMPPFCGGILTGDTDAVKLINPNKQTFLTSNNNLLTYT